MISVQEWIKQGNLARLNKEYERAFQFYLKAAQAGSAEAMFLIGTFQEYEALTPEDMTAWLAVSAEAGFPKAFGLLAAKYMLGDGVKQDAEKALYWAERDVEQDPTAVGSFNMIEMLKKILPEEQKQLGTEKQEQIGTAKQEQLEHKKQEQLEHKKQEQLEHKKQEQLENRQAESEPKQKDDGTEDVKRAALFLRQNRMEEAFRAFQSGAEKGNPDAQYNLSVMYTNGDGTEKDDKKAFALMKQAAEQGYPMSFYALAYQYLFGEGTERDIEQAEFWAKKAKETPETAEDAERLLYEIEKRKAAEAKDDGTAEGNEGMMLYQQGRMEEALHFFELGAEKGNAVCMNNLSVMYAKGQGTEENAEQSFAWMKQAAEHGNGSSFFSLAYKYFMGKGTEKDLKQAEYWAEKASHIPESEQEAGSLLRDIRRIRAQEKQDNGNREVGQGMFFVNRGRMDEALPYFLKAAEKGNAAAMNNLAIMYGAGDGVPLDEKKSFAYMKQAAEKENGNSFYPLACKYAAGSGTPVDLKQAEYWAEKALSYPKSKEDAEVLLAELKRRSNADDGTKELNAGVALYEQGRMEEAFRAFEAAAEKGNPAAMNNLSVMYTNGEGTEQNDKTAFAYMKQAAELDNAGSFYPLAYKYLAGKGTEVDLEQAEHWAKKSAEASASPEKANAMLLEIERRRAAEADNGEESLQRGIAFYERNRMEEALKAFEESAEKGNATALNNLSVMYSDGNGVKQDMEKSLDYMKQAAERGYEKAPYYLALKYYQGAGIPVDLKEAARWAEQAKQFPETAKQAEALLKAIKERQEQEENGTEEVRQGMELIHQGRPEEAFSFFLKGAEKGNPAAMHDLSVMYEQGDGIPKDMEKSLFYMREAAELGYEKAPYYTALKYYHGAGTPVDLKQAAYWAEKALHSAKTAENAQGLLAAIRQREAEETAASQEKSPEQQTESDTEALTKGFSFYQKGEMQEAFRAFEASAAQGNVTAMNNLSVMYARGEGVEKDPQKAFLYMKKAAEGGNRSSFYPLALKYFAGSGTSSDYEQAELWANRAVQAGQSADHAKELLEKIKANRSKTGAFDLGMQAFQKQEYADAMKYFKEAAKAGNKTAMHNTAVLYLQGLGVEQSPELATEWMQKAADAGYTEDAALLADRFFRGIGCRRNLALAEQYARRHCEAFGSSRAMETILEQCSLLKKFPDEMHGLFADAVALYQKGEYKRALELAKEAAYRGYPPALSMIGRCYYFGQGLEQSYEKAYAFFEQAARLGDSSALEFQKKMQ